MMHRSCFRPRSETGISIGPRSTEFGAASPEASVELDPLCARCTYICIAQYHNTNFSALLGYSPANSSIPSPRKFHRVTLGVYRSPRAHANTPSTHDRVSADTAADLYPHPRNGLPLPAASRLRHVPDWRLVGCSRSRTDLGLSSCATASVQWHGALPTRWRFSRCEG